MAWIRRAGGLFSLRDSDNHCGSYLTIRDAAAVLEVSEQSLASLPVRIIEGVAAVSELDVHKAWGRGNIPSPQLPKIGNATRSFDELILRKLIQLALPGAEIDCQIPFGRKRVDLAVMYGGRLVHIEFLGPSHFIPQYRRDPRNPRDRKAEIEGHFGTECVLWPYWIQRCTRNIRTLMGEELQGMASVWSTKAMFGDFVACESADLIVEISARFNAVRPEGLGYMYGATHTQKPVHPIVSAIAQGKADKDVLIPRGSTRPESFWLPPELIGDRRI